MLCGNALKIRDMSFFNRANSTMSKKVPFHLHITFTIERIIRLANILLVQGKWLCPI